jgi:WD40 repeat protein
VILYDADTGAEQARLDQRPDLRGVFFVSDRLLAISSLNGALALYDTDTLTKVRTLNGSRGFIEDVQASRDGDLVVVRGGDRNVQLIDVATGTPVGGQISIPVDERRGVALRPDGLELAVGGGTPDGIAIWNLDPAEWMAAACRVAGRNLTEDEWNTYIGTLSPYHQTCSTAT